MHVAVVVLMAVLVFLVALVCAVTVTLTSLDLIMDAEPDGGDPVQIARVDLVVPWCATDDPGQKGLAHAVDCYRRLSWCDRIHLLVAEDVTVPKEWQLNVVTHVMCGQEKPTHNPRAVDTFVHRVPKLSHWFVKCDWMCPPEKIVPLSALFTPCRRPLWCVQSSGMAPTVSYFERDGPRLATARALKQTSIKRMPWNLVELASPSLRPSTVLLDQESLAQAKLTSTFPFSALETKRNLDFGMFVINWVARHPEWRPHVFLIRPT